MAARFWDDAPFLMALKVTTVVVTTRMMTPAADGRPLEDVEYQAGEQPAPAGTAGVFRARADVFKIHVLLFVSHPLPPASYSHEYTLERNTGARANVCLSLHS